MNVLKAGVPWLCILLALVIGYAIYRAWHSYNSYNEKIEELELRISTLEASVNTMGDELFPSEPYALRAPPKNRPKTRIENLESSMNEIMKRVIFGSYKDLKGNPMWLPSLKEIAIMTQYQKEYRERLKRGKL